MRSHNTSPTPSGAEISVARCGYEEIYSLCDGKDGQHTLKLWKSKTKAGRYAVTYGCQWSFDMTQRQASDVLGACLMHQAVGKKFSAR